MKGADKDELGLRKDFQKTSNDFINSVQVYDADITTQTVDNAKTLQEYEDVVSDLTQIKEEYEIRLEEKKKRDEM